MLSPMLVLKQDSSPLLGKQDYKLGYEKVFLCGTPFLLPAPSSFYGDAVVDRVTDSCLWLDTCYPVPHSVRR